VAGVSYAHYTLFLFNLAYYLGCVFKIELLVFTRK